MRLPSALTITVAALTGLALLPTATAAPLQTDGPATSAASSTLPSGEIASTTHLRPARWVQMSVGAFSYPEEGVAYAGINAYSHGKAGLPYHSWMQIELHACDGTITRRNADAYVSKSGNSRWGTTLAADIGVDADAGPYRKMVVKVRSKGRATVSRTITKTDLFVLGCDGRYEVHEDLKAPRADQGRPITSRYGLSVRKAVARHADFGTPVVVGGKLTPGAKVRIKGAAAIVNGKRRSGPCTTEFSFDYPGRPNLLATGGGDGCNDALTVPRRKLRFWNMKTQSETSVRASAVGKRLFAGTSISVPGGMFSRHFDMGIVRR